MSTIGSLNIRTVGDMIEALRRYPVEKEIVMEGENEYGTGDVYPELSFDSDIDNRVHIVLPDAFLAGEIEPM